MPPPSIVPSGPGRAGHERPGPPLPEAPATAPPDDRPHAGAGGAYGGYAGIPPQFAGPPPPPPAAPTPNVPAPRTLPGDNIAPGAPNGPGNPAASPATNPYLTDPGYLAALAQEQSGIGTINQSLKDAMTRLIVNYGDPSLAAQAGFGLDPQAAAFARQNYLSGNGALARLDNAHSHARQAIINRLAAHGLLQSGDTGYQEGQEDQSYGNNVYDAQQSVLNQILGLRGNALSDIQNLHGGVTSALQTAWQNFLDHPDAFGVSTGGTPGENPTPGGGQPAAPDDRPPTGQNPSPKPPAKTSAKPPTKPSAKKAVVKQLANAYTSGRKARG